MLARCPILGPIFAAGRSRRVRLPTPLSATNYPNLPTPIFHLPAAQRLGQNPQMSWSWRRDGSIPDLCWYFARHRSQVRANWRPRYSLRPPAWRAGVIKRWRNGVIGDCVIPNYVIVDGIKVAMPDDSCLDVAIQFLHAGAGTRWIVVLEVPRLQVVVGWIGWLDKGTVITWISGIWISQLVEREACLPVIIDFGIVERLAAVAQHVTHDTVIGRHVFQAKLIANFVSEKRVVTTRSKITIVLVNLDHVSFHEVQHVVCAVIEADVVVTSARVPEAIVVGEHVRRAAASSISKDYWRRAAKWPKDVVLSQVPGTPASEVETLVARPGCCSHVVMVKTAKLAANSCIAIHMAAIGSLDLRVFHPTTPSPSELDRTESMRAGQIECHILDAESHHRHGHV